MLQLPSPNVTAEAQLLPHASWLSEKPTYLRILLTFQMRPAPIALNYSIKNIQNDVHQIITTYK